MTWATSPRARIAARLMAGVVATMVGVVPVAGAERTAGPCARSLDEYQIRVWTRKDGLPLDTVYAVAQTPDGFLWVGTEDGAARFDGNTFEPIDLHPATAVRESEAVYGLAVDARGGLHFATGSSGVLQLRGGQPVAWSSPALSKGSVWAVLPDAGGGRASVAGTGLVRYEGATVRAAPGAQPDSSLTALALRRAGGVWLGYGGKGIRRHDGTGFRMVPALASLDEIYVEELAEDDSGALWIAAREGLWRLNGAGLRLYTTADGVPPGAVRSVMRDLDGRVWVGTAGTAIARQCGERFEQLDLGKLAVGQVESLFQSREGSIWLATSGGGLLQLVPAGVMPLTTSHGLPDAPILPILQARDGAMWIGTFGAGVVRWRDGVSERFGTRNGLSDDNVLSLAQSPDGAVWVGTRKGLNRIDAGRVTRVAVADADLRVTSVPALHHDGRRLWVGAKARLAWIDDTGRIRAAAEAPKDLGSMIGYLHSAPDGRLWLGTEGSGVHVMYQGRVEAAPFNSRLPSQSVMGFHTAADGGLWIASAGGLAHWDGRRLGIVSTRQGLLDDQIMRLLSDDQGRLWMSGNRGVFVAPERDVLDAAAGRRTRVEGLAFDERDGMPRAETNGGFQPAGWRATDGRLWFPTTSGIARFDPAVLAPPAPPTVSLLGVTSDGVRHPPGASLALEPRPKLVAFTFSAPSFIHARRLEFQYRLQGFDDAWYAADASRIAHYRRLPPGRYRFEVRARHAPGPWSTPTGMTLGVRPHLLENAWFRMAVGLVVLVLAGGLLRLQLRAQGRRQERRMQAQKLESIGLLATGIAHDFNNILAAILPRIENLREGIGLGNPLREQADQVREATERGAGLSRQLLAFGQRQAIDPQWSSLSVELESIAAFLRRLLPGTIELGVLIGDDPGPCRIDPVQLQQVLLNLTLNARDSMPGGGRLEIGLARCRDIGEVEHAGLNSSQPHARITVRDSGVGISAKERDRIFEPFFTTKAPGRGTGLGLAITRTIVQEAGGALGVESAPGEGTAFHVYLPVSPGSGEAVGAQPAIDRDREEIRAILRRYGADAVPTASAGPVADKAHGERRLLVVDDDPAVAETVADVARERGFEVAIAHEGGEFLRTMDAWQPTDVVIDLSMPGQDAVELVRILSERGVQARVMLMSGLGTRVLESVQRAARERGLTMAGVLAKPFRREDLLALLEDTREHGRRAPVRAHVAAQLTSHALEQAIAERQLVLHYQPKVRLADGQVSGFEALVRWQHPVRGLVPPDAFIPLAESSGLILPLTDLVLELGLAWLVQQSHQPPLTLALNLSGKGIDNPELADALHARCKAIGLDPGRVILELTESSAATQPTDAADTLNRLRIKGFQLSIDDFGTGFSSMVQLSRLPFTSIKIDKSFVMSMLDSAESRKIVESTIALGKSLGLSTVAEGVEQADVLAALRALGCDEAQGYLIARPMDEAAARAWLAAGQGAAGAWIRGDQGG